MIKDEFLESLPDDPVETIRVVCKAFLKFDITVGKPSDPDAETKKSARYNEYVEWLGLFQAIIKNYGLPLSSPEIEIDRGKTIKSIITFAVKLAKEANQSIAEITLRTSRERFLAKFGKVFMYEFTDGDLARIQTLIHELREFLTNTEIFEEEHRGRLLKRLESLQSELHKKVSSLNKFWGLMIDAGVALGRIGEDAKPFFDRIKEMVEIVWRTQARAEELPSGLEFPLLSPPVDENVIQELNGDN